MVNYAGPHLVWAKGKGLCCLRLAGVCGHWMPLFPQTYNSKTTQKKITTAEKAGRHHAESLPIRETAREHWVFLRNLGMAKDGRKSLFLTVSRILLLVILCWSSSYPSLIFCLDKVGINSSFTANIFQWLPGMVKPCPAREGQSGLVCMSSCT